MDGGEHAGVGHDWNDAEEPSVVQIDRFVSESLELKRKVHAAVENSPNTVSLVAFTLGTDTSAAGFEPTRVLVQD
jgi:hypothetical protein